MSENRNELYWLHVPLTAIRGTSLGAEQSQVVIFGKRAQLFTRKPLPQPDGAVNATDVRQWLLFDPMEKAEAEALFENLKARLPVFSMRTRASFRIGPLTKLESAVGETYNGPIPTLIPADRKPYPLWTDSSVNRQLTGWEGWLEKCPAVEDERLIAALSLFVSADDDVLQRSQFLTYLTILDSLSEQWPRDAAAIAWIKAKLKEQVAVDDHSLSSALQNLKNVSHGTALRALVKRAASAKGLTPAEIKSLIATAGDLYSSRSDLSHAGKSVNLNVNAARELAALVIEQAIQDPTILDSPTVEC